MSKRCPNATEAFAILRADGLHPSPQDDVTVVKVLTSQQDAEAEVVRLNHVNAGKGCTYWSQSTRIIPEPKAETE